MKLSNPEPVTKAAEHRFLLITKAPAAAQKNDLNKLRTVGKRRRLVVKGQPRNKITDLAGID